LFSSIYITVIAPKARKQKSGTVQMVGKAKSPLVGGFIAERRKRKEDHNWPIGTWPAKIDSA
jgi:hypothetical protein